VDPSAEQTLTVAADDTGAFVQTFAVTVFEGEFCTKGFTIDGDIDIGVGIMATATTEFELINGVTTATLLYPSVTLATLCTPVVTMVDNFWKEIN
jgi:hypothetical protein